MTLIEAAWMADAARASEEDERHAALLITLLAGDRAEGPQGAIEVRRDTGTVGAPAP
jgi:hypothetical protein